MKHQKKSWNTLTKNHETLQKIIKLHTKQHKHETYLEHLNLTWGTVDQFRVVVIRLHCLDLQTERHALLPAVFLGCELCADAIDLKIWKCCWCYFFASTYFKLNISIFSWPQKLEMLVCFFAIAYFKLRISVLNIKLSKVKMKLERKIHRKLQ